MRGTPISPRSATNGAKVRERCFATCPSCGGDVVGRMDTFIITCEHGGNRIPAPYRRLFREQRALLDSHRGYDPGSLVMAKALARAFAAPAGGFDCQPPAYRSQSLDRPPTTFFGDDPRRAGPDPGADRRTALPDPSHAGRASHRASGVARPTRDPHFVAQLYRGAGR